MERHSGQQRWNVSLAQYSLTMEPPRGVPPRRAPPLQLRLQLQEDQSLCATASVRGECLWSHPFASAPVLAYHVDRATGARQHAQRAPSAVPQLAPCSNASSARAWWPWAARHSQSEAQPLGTQPPPQVLERAASKVAGFTAFDPRPSHGLATA